MSAGPWDLDWQKQPWERNWKTAAPAAPPPSPGQVALDTGVDVAKSAASGIGRGVAGIPGMAGDLVEALRAGYKWYHGADANPEIADAPRPGFLPTSAEVTQAATAAGVPGLEFQPTTTAGRYAGTVAEMLPSALALGPGGAVRRAVTQAVIPGVASEAAGQAAHAYAPDYETAARVTAGLVTGAAAGAGAPRGGQEAMRDALRAGGITADEVRAAQALMARADVPIDFGEALNQVTNGRASRVSQLTRVAANSGGEGGEAFARMYADRPNAVRGAFERRMADVAAQPYATDVAAARGRDAADATLRTVRGERTAATGPHYRAGEADVVPHGDMQRALAEVDAVIAANPASEGLPALQAWRNSLIEQGAVSPTPAVRTPVSPPGEPNRVLRYETTPATPGSPEVPYTSVGDLERRLQAANQTAYGPANTVAEREGRRLVGAAAQPVNAAVEAASPATARGRAVHEQMSRELVEPYEYGPTGKIAAVDPMTRGASAQQGAALVGVGEERATPMVTQQSARLIAQDSRAVETMVRDYLGNAFKTATSRDSPTGGAVFRARTAGDPTMRANLEAVVGQLPNGQQRWAGVQNLLDTLEATGYKPAKGSDTAFNQQIQRAMREGGTIPSQLVEQASKGGLGAKAFLGQKWENYRLGQNTEELSRLITDRRAAPLLEQLASYDPTSARARAVVLRLLQIGATTDRTGQGGNAEGPINYLRVSPGK